MTKRKHEYKLWTKEEYDILKNQYGKIKTSELLILLPGRTISSIHGKAENNNIKGSHTNRKIYSFKEDFFDIPSIQNCYWAGFIAADGCVTDDNLLSFSQSGKDHQLLESFKEQCEYTGRVKKIIRYGKPISTLAINSIERWKDKLYKWWNITPRKTNTLQPPNITDLGQAMSFIIGYFDGDGSAHFRKKPSRAKGGGDNYYIFGMNFTGTLQVMKWIQENIILFDSNINKTKVSKKKKCEFVYEMSWSCEKARHLHSKIFTEFKIIDWKLERKWDKFYNLNYKLTNTSQLFLVKKEPSF